MTCVLLGDIPAPAIDAGAVLVVPFGSHEQHGPHLPHATDALLVAAVARRGAERAHAAAAVAPVVPYGVSPHHLGLGATFSLRSTTFLSVVADILATARASGFRRVLLLNGHGGNAGLLSAAANDEVAAGRLVCATASYWELAAEQLAALRRSPRGGMGHACELETALMLHLYPGLVKSDAIPGDNLGRGEPLLADDMLAPAPLGLGMRMRDEAPEGVLGAPRSADAQQGATFFEAITERVAGAIDTVAQRDPPHSS